MEVNRKFFRDPGTSFFIFGPRGTGKSTWLKNQFSDAYYIDLLSPELFRSLSAKPERLRDIIEGNPHVKIFIIDEIQKVPSLLDVIHQCIENNKNIRFIMTGSSSRKLKRSGIDLLAGRALHKKFFPFIAAELENYFSLEKALTCGMVPLVVNSNNPEDILKSYAALYLKEEVQSEGLVRNVGDFARFLEIISFSHGSLLNITEIARECQVGRKTAESYVQITEDLLLSFTLPVFTRRAKRHLISHNKFYFFDCGVFRSLRPRGPFDKSSEIEGGALEGLIGQHLQAWNGYGSGDASIYFWRTKSGNEVDFIVYSPEKIYAIEVKNSQTVRPQDVKGLKAFLEDYPEAEALLIYRGLERIKTGGILCMPAEQFLRACIPGEPLPMG